MIRENVRLAQKFEAMVRSDPRFEIPAARSETKIIIYRYFFSTSLLFRHMGMVVFRLKGDCSMTEALLKKLNSSGKLHAVPCCIKGRYVIRY